MKRPLTEVELEKFLEDFKEYFYRTYEKALESGALTEEETKEGSYIAAKFALFLTAENYASYGTKSRKKSLDNLRYFV